MSERQAKKFRALERDVAALERRLPQRQPHWAWAGVVIPVLLAALTPTPISHSCVALAAIVALGIAWTRHWARKAEAFASVVIVGLAAALALVAVPWIKRTATDELAAAVSTGVSKALVSWRPPNGAKPTPTTPPHSEEKPPTLVDLFKNDFGHTMKFSDDSRGIQWQNGEILTVKTQVYTDFPAKAQFVGFYIPASPKTYEASLRLVDAVWPAINDLPKRVGGRSGHGDQSNTLEELTFSGRVLLYHEGLLSIPQKANIIEVFARSRFDVQFRGPDYLGDAIVTWHRQRDAKGRHD